MKKWICCLGLFCAFTASAQTVKLEKIWETDTIIAIPESVLPDPAKSILYVSLIDGQPWEADGKGGIAILNMEDGNLINPTFITGLHAPKGMAIYKNRLYVADMNQLVVVNIRKGKIDKKITIEGAEGLNDVSADQNGIVYVSDSKKGKIFRVEKDVATLYLDSLPGLNGINCLANELNILKGKTFIRANHAKVLTTKAELPQGGDGIEPIGNGDYLVSSWPGYLFYVYADGKVVTLLETASIKKNTADIGYNPYSRVIYVPTFFAKTVVAYKIKM